MKLRENQIGRLHIETCLFVVSHRRYHAIRIAFASRCHSMLGDSLCCPVYPLKGKYCSKQHPSWTNYPTDWVHLMEVHVKPSEKIAHRYELSAAWSEMWPPCAYRWSSLMGKKWCKCKINQLSSFCCWTKSNSPYSVEKRRNTLLFLLSPTQFHWYLCGSLCHTISQGNPIFQDLFTINIWLMFTYRGLGWIHKLDLHPWSMPKQHRQHFRTKKIRSHLNKTDLSSLSIHLSLSLSSLSFSLSLIDKRTARRAFVTFSKREHFLCSAGNRWYSQSWSSSVRRESR